MKLHLPICGVILLALAPVVRAAVTTDNVTIKLGEVTLTLPILPLPPTPPTTVVPGAHVQLVIAPASQTNPVVAWYKDGHLLAATGTTLDIAKASSADNGTYSAETHAAGATTVTWRSESASLFVTKPEQRLSNVSTRARIDANQPFFLTGFVVEPGPGYTGVVVRAVGPTLAAFGVTDALAAPQLQVMDAKGRVINPGTTGDGVQVTPIPGSPPSSSSAEAAAEAAGAFPLTPGGKDIAQVYLLPQGAYTAVLSSADGGSGTALLEIYQLTY